MFMSCSHCKLFVPSIPEPKDMLGHLKVSKSGLGLQWMLSKACHSVSATAVSGPKYKVQRVRS